MLVYQPPLTNHPPFLDRFHLKDSRHSYVPYQDSKLTMLLSQGLGGDSKTSVIICAAMDPTHAVETIASLRCVRVCKLSGLFADSRRSDVCIYSACMLEKI